MNHNSETGQLKLPEDTIYIDTTRPEKMIEQQLFVLLEKINDPLLINESIIPWLLKQPNKFSASI